MPSAEWGIVNPGGTACFCVMPFWLGKDEVDLDALTSALVGRIGIPFPSSAVYGVKEWKDRSQPHISGRSLAWEGTHDGQEMLYRVRVVQTDEHCYLLAAWYDKTIESRTDLLDEALDRVRFAKPQPGPPPGAPWLNRREQTAHALLFNGIGNYYFARREAEPAETWFKRRFAAAKSPLL